MHTLVRVHLLAVTIVSWGCAAEPDTGESDYSETPIASPDPTPPLAGSLPPCVNCAGGPPAFESVPPVPVSGALACATQSSNTGRKVAVDASGIVHVAMRCGGEATVATSSDRGHTFGAPSPLGVANVVEMAVEAGPPGIAYAAAVTDAGDLYFTSTQDGGDTWSTPLHVGGELDNWIGVGLATFGDRVWVGAARLGELHVWTSARRGAGGLAALGSSIPVAAFDLVVDPRTGELYVVGDTPDLHLRRSVDGLEFGPELNPPGQVYYSDWAIGHDSIYVVGTDPPTLIVIPISDPLAAASTNQLSVNATSQACAVAADRIGHAYIATGSVDGAIHVARYRHDASRIESREIGPGEFPAIVALPDDTGAVVVYTHDGAVWSTVQRF